MHFIFRIANIDILFKTEDIESVFNKFCVKSQKSFLEFIDLSFKCQYESYQIYELNNRIDRIMFYQGDILLAIEDWTKCFRINVGVMSTSTDSLHIQFYANAVKHHMIQVHSSLVEYNGYGVMFLGPSGIGKTTQAELWNQYLDALIINGDIVYVEDKGEEFIGWGTPWHGSSPYCENTSVPVKALIVLKQGSENSLRRLEGLEMVSSVGAQVFYPDWVEQGVELALETLDHVLKGIPVYELVNRADEESVMMVKQAVFGNEED